VGGALPAALLALCAAAQAAGGPTIRTGHGCYRVGQAVRITGAGFAPSREFDLTVDGVDFGQSTTNASGGFAVRAGLGSLRGVAQHVEALSASDGSSEAHATVTLTLRSGARFLATSGNAGSLRAPVEVWDFSPDGPRQPVYLHYVSPAGQPQTSIALGRTGGQCGYLRTNPIRVFPFTPSKGSWVFQIDTQRSYAAHPPGAVARFSVRVA
jgi:hypothetical protein